MDYIILDIAATADSNAVFKVDNSIRKYTLQIEYAGLDGDGTLALFQDIEKAGNYTNVIIDNDGNAVSETITGTDVLTINNSNPPAGFNMVKYTNVDNAAGTVVVKLYKGG